MTDTQSTIIAIGCAGLVAFVVQTVLLAVYVFTDRIMNRRKLEKLADRIFAKQRETSNMSEEKGSITEEHTLLAAGAVNIANGGCDCEPDPGIAPLVKLLKENGFYVTDCGDGKSKPPEQRTLEIQHAFVVTKKDALISETQRLYNLLQSQGITGFTVEGNYGPADGVSVIMVLGKEEAELVQAVGEVLAPAEPAADPVAADQEALREAAAIEG